MDVIASVGALGYVALCLWGIARLARMPRYAAAVAINSAGGVNLLEVLYYFCVGFLAFHNPGTAAWVLLAVIAAPIAIGWLTAKRRIYFGYERPSLLPALVLTIIQLICIVIMVF